MQKTSINIQPVKNSSEYHNQRVKPLDYVRTDLAENNASKIVDTISNRLEEIKEKYHKSVGQKMQKKATPIREGVVVIEEDTSLDDLQKFADQCEEEFGIKAFQFYIHKDEGHWKDKKWKPNLHAHIVFDWTDEKGKSRKLNPKDMARMQTILAESLGMQRGVSSDRKHLSSIQFKQQAELSRLSEDLSKRAQEVESISKNLAQLQKKHTTKKTKDRLMSNLYNFIGMSKDEKKINTLEGEKKGLEKAIQDAREREEQTLIQLQDRLELTSKLDEINKDQAEEISKIKTAMINLQEHTVSLWEDFKLLQQDGVLNKESLTGLKGFSKLKEIGNILDEAEQIKRDEEAKALFKKGGGLDQITKEQQIKIKRRQGRKL